jgi:GT2 family glycosyltransferase
MSQPAISVVLPVFNFARYLRQALASLRWQTFTDWECICVDDGSTDGTGEILRQFAAADPRFRIVDQAHQGLVGALNSGVRAARADWIARMDGDDVAVPERLALQYEFVHKNPECLVVGGDTLCIDPEGRPIVVVRHAVDHDEIERRLLIGADGSLAHPAVLMRREAVIDAGLYRPQHEWVEDLDLWLRLVHLGRAANVGQVVVHYRQHDASVCASRVLLQGQRKQQLLAEVRQARGLPGLPVNHLGRKSWRRPMPIACKWARRAARSGYYRTAYANWRRHVRSAPLSPMILWETCEVGVRAIGSLIRFKRPAPTALPDWRPWDCTAFSTHSASRAA